MIFNQQIYVERRPCYQVRTFGGVLHFFRKIWKSFRRAAYLPHWQLYANKLRWNRRNLNWLPKMFLSYVGGKDNQGRQYT
jgi:hypothetical protein